jgi:hypothetical protein
VYNKHAKHRKPCIFSGLASHYYVTYSNHARSHLTFLIQMCRARKLGHLLVPLLRPCTPILALLSSQSTSRTRPFEFVLCTLPLALVFFALSVLALSVLILARYTTCALSHHPCTSRCVSPPCHLALTLPGCNLLPHSVQMLFLHCTGTVLTHTQTHTHTQAHTHTYIHTHSRLV